jgi:hypothetical protein
MKKRIGYIFKNIEKIKTTDVETLESLNLNFQNFFQKTKRDAKLLISNINSTFYLLGSDFSGLKDKHSELNYKSYNSLGDIIKSVKTALIPSPTFDPTTPYSEEFIIGDFKKNESEKWFFVNGIATSKEIAKINGKALSEIFQNNIHILYNPSQSIPIDLLESILERTYGRKTAITDSIYSVIKDELIKGTKIKLMGHSQGGIIVSSVVNRLVDDESMTKYLKNIELYTFASAADEVKHHVDESTKLGHPVPYNEHFVNTKDLVARLGKGATSLNKNISGEVFEFEAAGHLLNSHYLKNFVEGKYDLENKSRLKEHYVIKNKIN